MVQIAIGRILFFFAFILTPAQFCKFRVVSLLASIIDNFSVRYKHQCLVVLEHDGALLNMVHLICYCSFLLFSFHTCFASSVGFSFFSCLNVLIWLAYVCLKAFLVNQG